MPTPPNFDTDAAHRHFAAQCFNDAWDLIEKPERTAQDDRMMVAMNQASIYHWLHREDCDDRRLSIGFWQASRIQALLGHADEARRHGEVSLSYSAGLKPFFVGYAYEALARAELLAGRGELAAQHMGQARACAAQVGDKAERELLLRDLDSLRD